MENTKFQFRNVGIFLLVLSPIFIYIGVNYVYTNQVPQEKFPYVHFNGLDPATEAYISWETTTAQGSTVWLGTEPGALFPQATNVTPATFHRVKLTGLTPDTSYWYHAGDNTSGMTYTGKLGYFKTAPVSTVPFSIGLFSDTQQLLGIGHYETIASRVATEPGLSFVTCVGDIVQEGDDISYWNLFMYQSRGWMDTVPFVPVIGNHDYDDNNPNASYYTRFFGFSYATGPYANHFFYDFNWSNAQFLIAEISTTGTRDNAIADLNDQWLNETLARGQDKTFRIVMFHRNLMTSSSIDDHLVDRVTAIAETYNVSLVIFGHWHHYERMLYKGIRYICLGGGGGLQDMAFRIIPESEALNIGPSYTRLTFDDHSLRLTTLSEQGDVIDACTLVTQGTKLVLEGDA